MLGAYGSHGLRGAVDPATLTAYATAVDYLFYQALGLLAVGLIIERAPQQRGLTVALGLLLLGIMLFCGGIVLPILGGPAWLGRVVPSGGLLLMAAWLTFAWSVWRLPGTH
jgi:uncharacterized membrane protein YgdD (TMEM256/DUF423 family)